MRVIGFNFSKISIEKFSDKLDKLQIKTRTRQEFVDITQNGAK